MSVRRILLTTDAVGGVWTYSLDLARRLAAEGVAVVLATLGPPPSPDQCREVAGLAGVTLVPCDAPLDWMAADAAAVRAGGERIASLAAEHGVDLVQLHAAALAAGVDYGVPVVVVVHSCVGTWWDAVEAAPLPDDLAWRDALTLAGLSAADAVIAPTRAFAEALRRVHRLPFTPRVVHNGRAPVGVPARALADHAFTAGRLWDGGKNIATLDRAAALGGVRIVAAGSAREPDGRAVAFTALDMRGMLDPHAVAAMLAGRPVYVSAALYEPFGLAVLEAAQAGCALVLSDIPTFRELWDGAATFVDPRDAAAFGRAIAALLADPAARDTQGLAARERAARYTTDATVAGMRAIYAELVAKGRLAA